jgi:GntR family transcriptional regulator/MocR family aminotransferase
MTGDARRPGRQANASEILAVLRRDHPQPLREQLEVTLREAIRTGRLPANHRLPSSRTLAADLGISRGVVTEAYTQLAAEGYLATRARSSVTVTSVIASTAAPVSPVRLSPPPLYDLRPGVPELDAFPTREWIRSLNEAVAELPRGHLSYGDAQGVPELRAELAAYLGRVRGLQVAPERVVVVTGFAQGLGLLCGVLRSTGTDTLAVEDPSSPRQRAFVARSGLRIHGLEVDEAGARPDALGGVASPGACLLTPAHQFPTGVVLAPERRGAFLAWARETGGLLIEDDYDAEFRYDRSPVGALQGLAPESVVYAGSVSKTLAPGLRLGWLVVPERFVDALAAAKHDADLGGPVLEQLAFARLLRSGRFERHLRRCRDIYRERRDALVGALSEHAPCWSVSGVAAGLHLVVTLPAGSDDVALCSRAAVRRVAAAPLSPYGLGRAPSGLVLGYGRIHAEATDQAIRRLVDAELAPGARRHR